MNIAAVISARDFANFYLQGAGSNGGYLHRPTHFVRLRFDIPRVLRPWNVKCHVKTKRWYTMLRFKCWYYDQAIQNGSEDRIKSLLPDHLPDDIQLLYDHAHQ